jgi:hypothetical protein
MTVVSTRGVTALLWAGVLLLALALLFPRYEYHWPDNGRPWRVDRWTGQAVVCTFDANGVWVPRGPLEK